MEGHPGYEDPRAVRVLGPVETSEAARKRVFLRLEDERRSLAARVRPRWRPRRRYEDLSLVMMLARFERDWLGRPEPHVPPHDPPRGDGDYLAQRLAGWATPWGVPPRSKLEADIDGLEGALEGLGRWLTPRAVARARARARERLAAFTTWLEALGPTAWETAADEALGLAAKTPRRVWPSQAGATAIAALLAAGAGAFLILLHPGSGPGGSASGPAAGLGQVPEALRAAIQRGSEQRAHVDEAAGPPGGAAARGDDRASSKAPGQSAPSVPEPAPAPEPAAPVAQPVAAPQPAPASPPGPQASSVGEGAKSTAGCPPEFGYEC
jgi:hypothetical protein